MPDELKDKFQQLVADPPPPTAVPSEAVFAKVRTVRRRRTAGAAVLAGAAVVAIAVAGNSLTDINSSPPVSNTPGVVSTTVAPPPSPTTNPGTSSTNTSKSSTPPFTAPPPLAPPVGVAVTLTPKVTGRSLLMKVTIKGTLVSPLAEGRELPLNTGFLDRSMGTDYKYGDGETSGSDAGAVSCTGARKRVTSEQTYSLLDGPHVYQQAGTYTFTYTIRYCGAKGQTLETTKSARIVIR